MVPAIMCLRCRGLGGVGWGVLTDRSGPDSSR